ncbi:MAG TPA: cupredoxin domain-containing protein [Candidatus Acidoferrum sp.]|nr:cupredoxin domain-containing protein [Candidatus Acidoferrum sp.]
MQAASARVIFAAVIFLAGAVGAASREQAAGSDQQATVIEVSAKKYQFTPAEIHVKKGTKVKLVVHSVDETHGIKLKLNPEGSKSKSAPGLRFDDPASNGKVEKGKDQVLEFVAEQAGKYDFECAKFCGFGHRHMKGKLIVDE